MLFRFSTLSLTLLCLLPVTSDAQDWPEFLGPSGQAKSEQTAPTQWNESENMLWKVDLPGSGSSSPIVVGDRVFVTSYIDDANAKRQLLCFDKVSGDQLWATDFLVEYREDNYQGYITEHGYASNTPISDGQDVFVFLGKGGVHSVDQNGRIKWSVDVGKGSSNRRWGSAASPVLIGDVLIINASEEAKAIVALDKSTGKELWRQEVDLLELTYGTPRTVTLKDGTVELAISVPEEIWALNPKTGKLKWYASTPMTGNVSPSVIVDGEMIYSFGGYRASGSIGVRAGGKHDVTDTHVAWTNRSSSYVATPLLHDGRFYWIDDRGIAYCTSADDGEVIYKERVKNLNGNRPVYASPVLIGGNIYVVTRRSGTLIYAPGETFEPVSQNKIAGDDTDFNASPAVSESRIYLRSNQALYCVGPQK